MSSTSTPVTAELFDYIRDHTQPEDPFLLELKREAEAAAIPAIWISHEQARLMQILLRLAGAREVVEVGTLAGYSAICMARALPAEGRVRTIELSDPHADFAEAWVARSDVAGRVEVHRGAGVDVLPGFESASADVAFLDADKANYGRYLEESLRIVRPGGLVMVDNAFAFGQLLEQGEVDPSVGAIRAFNDSVPGVERFDSVIVPMGDGLWVGVVRP
jgi:O-methyltransferase